MMCLLSSSSTFTCSSKPHPNDSGDEEVGNSSTLFDGNHHRRHSSQPGSSYQSSSPSSASDSSSNASVAEEELANFSPKNFSTENSNGAQNQEIQSDQTSSIQNWLQFENNLLVENGKTSGRESSQPFSHTLDANSEPPNDLDTISVVSVTMCNMKPNIFDIRRKRGRKRSRDTQLNVTQRRETTSSEDSILEEVGQEPEPKKILQVVVEDSSSKSDEEESQVVEVQKCQLSSNLDESRAIVQDIIEELVMPSKTNSDQTPESAVVPFIALNQVEDLSCDDPTPEDFNEPDPLSINNYEEVKTPSHGSSRRESCDLDLHLSEDDLDNDDNGMEIESCNLDCDLHAITQSSDIDDDDEIEIIEIKKKEKVNFFDLRLQMKQKYCLVSLVDVFQNSPLKSIKCYGCSNPYSSSNDITLDFECQTMSIVCSQCSWWTRRRISASIQSN